MNLLKNILKQNYFIIFIFLIFMGSIIVIFEKSNQDKLDTHLQNTLKNYKVQYKRVYESFNKLSQNTFYGIINKPNIYDNVKLAYKQDKKTQDFYRQKLYKVFISDYTRLVDFDFKQLHFHFPDNTSFLRMHRPQFYGDSLTNVRDSIRIVNSTSKPIDGFEMGKVIHGFRFVYPLFDNNLKHIGSVEVSVSAEYFKNYYEKYYETDVHFLLKKDIAKRKLIPEELKKQTISIENSDYFGIDIDNIYQENELLHFSSNEYYSEKQLQIIKEKMRNAEDFILYKNINSTFVTISYIAIPNVKGVKNSAYLVLYTKSDYLQHIHDSFYKLLFILLLISIIFILFLSRRYKNILEKRRKDEILAQQSKMASMGEMIGNIAHQWRQPLSVISTAATGMKAQKEFGMLTDEIFNNNIEQIYHSTEYLSQTIEDFRNFFKTNKEKVSFTMQELIDESIVIFGTTFTAKKIKIIQNIDDITIVSYKNEIKQVIINLLKNGVDAMQENGIIIITIKEDKNKITIEIQDSGKGIPDNVIKRIFEPYFTTKHQSVGTGLGLYMSHEIVSKSLEGSIEVSNKNFQYEFESYFGACFRITLYKNKLEDKGKEDE